MSSRFFTIGTIKFELRGRVLIANGEPVIRGMDEATIADIHVLADAADKYKEARHD